MNHPNNRYSFWLFLIWPFGALMVELYNNARLERARIVLWLFIVFFGVNFVSINSSTDSYVYLAKLQSMYKQNLSFLDFIHEFYYSDNAYLDVFQPMITYLIAQFTDNSKVLFGVFSLIFGYFYSKNIWFVLGKNTRINYFNVILILCFAFIIPFWSFNGFRFWTAAQVFFFGAYQYIFIKKKFSYILYICLSMFVHFSFAFFILLFFFWFCIQEKIHLGFILFILSIVFSTGLELNILTNLLEGNNSGLLSNKINSYTNEGYIKNIKINQSNLNWYVTLYKKSFSTALQILISVIFLFYRNFWEKNKKIKKILSFAFIFYAGSTLASIFPSGFRFLIVSNLFALTAIIKIALDFDSRSFNRWLILMTPVFLFFLVVSIREGFDFISLSTILSNPLFSVFFDSSIPLIELIK